MRASDRGQIAPPKELAYELLDSQRTGRRVRREMLFSLDCPGCGVYCARRFGLDSGIPEARGQMTMTRASRILFIALCVAAVSQAAHAQAVAPAPVTDEGWRVTVYPVLAWVPIDIGIDVNV